MNFPVSTLESTFDSLANSSITWDATDLAWFSHPSCLGDWIGDTVADPNPPSPITRTAYSDRTSGTVVDPIPSPPITDTAFSDWIGVTVVDPVPPLTITGTVFSDWTGGTSVDPNPPLTVTGAPFSDWIGGSGVGPNSPPPISETGFSDWMGGAGNKADAYNNFGTLNVWHEAANFPLVQTVNGANIYFQY